MADRNPIQRIMDMESDKKFPKIDERIEKNELQRLRDSFPPDAKADKEAERARLNRKEAEAEGQKYAKGGKVKSFKGYGIAKKV